MRRIPTYLIAAALVLAPSLAMACLWDTDTIQDELQTHADTFEVISGQFPVHGEAYYRARMERTRRELAQNPQSIEGLYDLGAAFVRLREYEQARLAFDEVESIAPDRYKTLSNQSVLFHQMGRLDKAIDFMARALEKRPDAHFSAGWLHHKMLVWQRDNAAEASPTADFLGRTYGKHGRNNLEYYAKRSAKELGVPYDEQRNPEKELLTLVRANPDFADAYLVLGDHLRGARKANLALWSYVKALSLKHPRKDLLGERIKSVLAAWVDAKKHGMINGKIADYGTTVASVMKDLERCAAWQRAFVQTETAMVHQGAVPDFKTVKAALEAKGIQRFAPGQHGMLVPKGAKGSPAQSGHTRRARSAANGPAKGHPAEGATPPVGDAQDADDIAKGEETQAEKDVEEAQGAWSGDRNGEAEKRQAPRPQQAPVDTPRKEAKSK